MHIDVDAHAVEQALAAYLRDAGAEPPDAVAGARRHHALPLWKDWVGCIALRSDGQLVFFTWDDPDKLEEIGERENDQRMVHAARAHASRRFLTITGLAPQRPSDAQTCPSCKATGQPFPQIHPNIVCECGGIGWVPNWSSK